jgi:diguanylate cyclase (GGDEF)-like protein
LLELGDSDLLFALVLALLVYTTVNSGLVAGAIAVSVVQPDMSKAFGGWDENVLEIATLCLGALVAVAYSINPCIVAFALPPLLVLHRAVLVHYLKEAADLDGKTGLLNAAAWHTQAERALSRKNRGAGPRGVLVLDLDHFKAVNDTHGHLAGDEVLAAVADTLRSEVRDRDLVGRFGGEEFVVLLAGLPGRGDAELEAVAERMRRRVASLRVEIPTPDGPLTIAGLTVSIGAAVQAGPEGDLRSLLQIADTALYSAKRAGRNMVRIGLSMPVQQSGPGQLVSSRDVPRGSS